MTRKIAVYGSLLTGLHNHRILAQHFTRGGAKLLGSDVLNIPYRMFDLGSYPGLIPVDEESGDKNENILVEVYEIDETTNIDIEMLEGYRSDEPQGSLYIKANVLSKFGDVEVYIYNTDTYTGLDDLEVEPIDGITDWKNYYLNQNY